MARKIQRKVEAAIIEKIGAVTAAELLALPDDSWGILRDRISDRRNGKDGLTARCMACDSPVYIQSAPSRGVNRPLFQHYAGGDPTCRWYHGKSMKPDVARAAQYQGRQESPFHRKMCELIGELAALDSRYVDHSIADYLPPTENDFGRYPDIHVTWKKFGSFVVEFQMSGSFQTEISSRCMHYEREGILLLWVLFGLETSVALRQNTIDIIRRHRGNAFVLDPPAVKASRENKTLMLSCYLRQEDGTLVPPKLVRFDELTQPRSCLPFHQDMIVAPRLEAINQRRRPWFTALEAWQENRYKPLEGLERRQSLLVAAAFSLVATANGHPRNYASDHENLSGMLNTFLSTGMLSRYTNILARLIEAVGERVQLTPKVSEHLRKFRDEDQANESAPEWTLLRSLLPEIFDPLLREELIYLDALPDWAGPPASTPQAS